MKLPVEVWMDMLSYLTDSRDGQRLTGTPLRPLWKRSISHLDLTKGHVYMNDYYEPDWGGVRRRDDQWFKRAQPLFAQCPRLKTITLPPLHLDMGHSDSHDCLKDILSDTRYRDLCLIISEGPKSHDGIMKLLSDGLLSRSAVYGHKFKFIFSTGRTYFLYNYGVCNGGKITHDLDIPIHTLLNPRGDELSLTNIHHVIFIYTCTLPTNNHWFTNIPETVQSIRMRIPLKYLENLVLKKSVVEGLKGKCFSQMTVMEIPVKVVDEALLKIFPKVNNFVLSDYVKYQRSVEELKEAQVNVETRLGVLRRDHPSFRLPDLTVSY